MENQPVTAEARQPKLIQITIGGAHLLGFATLALAISGLLFAYIDAKFDAIDQRFETVDAQFESVNAQFEAVAAQFAVQFEAVNRRIDDNTEELRLLRVNVEDINERLTAVEATIGLRAQAEMEDAQIAASGTVN